MNSPLSLDKLATDLKAFKTFLDADQSRDGDVQQLKTHISEACRLLEQNQQKIIMSYTNSIKQKYPKLDN